MDILTNQEFTYRQVPVSAYTGTLDSIKGNTVVWNQLVQNGNFADSSDWTGNNASISVSSNVLTGTVTTSHITAGLKKTANISFIANHQYFVSATASCSVASSNCVARFYATGNDFQSTPLSLAANTKTRVSWIIKPTNTFSGSFYLYPKFTSSSPLAVNDTFTFANVIIIDLTQMFGSNEPTIEEFTSLFPLPYYSYNTGELVSFNGTALKSVGNNKICKVIEKANLDSNGKIISDSQQLYDLAVGEVIQGKQYTFRPNHSVEIMGYFYSEPDIGSTTYDGARITNGTSTFTAKISGYVAIRLNRPETNAQLEFGSSPSTYSPYFTDTLSLPISTYFPTGMKSAGSVYDELTQSKAYTRVGSVDLGTLTWSYGSDAGHLRFYSNIVSGIQAPSSGDVVANVKCSNYEAVTEGQVYNNTKQGACITSTGRVMIYDSAYSDAATFTTAMSGVYLYYELATPTETDVSLDLTYNIEPNGTEEIYPTALMNGVVDLGSLTWTYAPTGQRFFVELTNAFPFSTTEVANAWCKDYSVTMWSGFPNDTTKDKQFAIAYTGGSTYLSIRDTNYSDADVFKTAKSGTLLYYQRNVSTPYTSPILADITYRGLIPVSVVASPTGSGTITGSGMYRYGESVTITAEPNDEIYRFLRYEDENGTTVSLSSTYTFTVGD